MQKRVDLDMTGSEPNGATAPPNDVRLLTCLLALHIITWTIYGTFALGAGVIHDDMIEAWNWAQVPQWGYYKHPPLFAWVTWAWFQLFPLADWSFYLLAAVNSAVGLAGVAALGRFFGLAPYRSTAVGLLVLTPLYGFLAMKFNANAVLIPIWPWATYFLLKSLETRSPFDGIALGLFGGLSMLGKYYSVLLAVAFFVSSLTSPHRRTYYRSAAPYLALFVAMLVFSPHAIWTVRSGFPTIEYALSKFGYPLGQLVIWACMTALAPVIFLTIPLLVIGLGTGRGIVQPVREVLAWIRDRTNTPLAVLACVPFVLTLGFGFVGHVKVSLSYTIPIFYLASLVMLGAIAVARSDRVSALVPRVAMAYCCFIMLIAAPVGFGRVHLRQELAASAIPELAEKIGPIWQSETASPLRYIAGGDRLIGGLSFYASDRPLYFVNYNVRQAAWISDANLVADGLLIVCRAQAADCLDYARKVAPPGSRNRSVQLAHSWFGQTARPVSYELTIIPPGLWQPVTPQSRGEPEISRSARKLRL